MKKLLILMGILLISFTLGACEREDTSTTPPIFASVTIEGTSPSDGTELSTYYKGKRADLAVGIELVNNSNFIIKSIVINGINYHFARFDSTSTNSMIYFDMSTGSTLGETIYSVDEIIYQDGNFTKSVYVDQNNEFKVFVYKDTPTVERENYGTTRESISIDFNVTDIDSVIEVGSLIVELYSGETKIQEKVLSVGQTSVLFVGLLANRHYDVKVIADYDLEDSLDMNNDVVMYSGSFTTLSNALPSAVIKNLVVSSNNILFDVTYHDDDGVTEIAGLSVAVYDGDTLVRETLISGSTTSISFDDLLNDTIYTLKVLSDYDLRDGHGIIVGSILAETEFETLPRLVPVPTILNLNIEENRVLFDIEIEDPDGLIDESTLVAKLYIDGILVEEANILSYVVDFELYNLFSNFEFIIEIEASYDLNDGEGVQANMVIFSETFTTLKNAIPTVIVDDVVVTQGYVTIDLDVFDYNETMKTALTAILYENDIAVKTIQFGLHEKQIVLDYLVKNSEVYSLEIVTDYNLRDGFGTIEDHVLFRTILVSRQPKAPAAELINIDATNDSITLDVNFMDVDGTVEAGSISVYLYLGDDLISTRIIGVGTTTIEFTGLLSNNEYEIFVTADFDLDDGAGLQMNQELILGNIVTEEKVIPTGILKDDGRFSDTESIWFNIEILDPDSVLEPGTLMAILYLNGVATGDTELLVVGDNFAVTFGGLLSDTRYDVEVILNYDLDDGALVIEDYILEETAISTDDKTPPSGNVWIIEATKEDITFNVSITDDNNTIVGQAKALLYIGETPTGDFINLNPGLNSNLSFNGILSDTYYTIRIEADYYLNDDLTYAFDDLLSYDSASTYERTMIYLLNGIENVELGKTDIEFDVFIIDDDLVSTTNLQAVLYKGGIATGDTIPLSIGANEDEIFTGLLAYSVYEIKIETDYNMRDGSIDVLAAELGSHTAVTVALFLPYSDITVTDIYDTEIVFDVDITDSDDTITDLTSNAVLYIVDEDLNETPTGAEIPLVVGTNPGLSFDGLEFGQDYVIKVVTDYNLNSGEADVEDAVLETQNVTTHQIIVMTEIVQDKKQISFELDTDDEFGIVTSDNLIVQLYDLNGAPVGSSISVSSASGLLLLNLFSDNAYSIEVSATYDIGAGSVTEVVYTYEFQTIALDEPIITINREPYHAINNDGGFVVAATTIDLEVEVGGDADGVITGTLTAYIYANGDDTTVIQQIVLIPGTNQIQFTGLDTVNNSYQILIRADADFNTDGVTSVLYVFDEITLIEGN